MPLALYIAEDGQKRMIEKTAKNAATSRANTLRTDRYYLVFHFYSPDGTKVFYI